MLELSGLAAAAASRALPHRRYDIEVPLRIEGRTCATLDRDGIRLLTWDIQDLDIVGPPLTKASGCARAWRAGRLPT